LHLDDRAPGATPATVALPEGGAIHVLRIAITGFVPPRLFVRCTLDGQILVAIDKAQQPAVGADG
jgi:hypothetical protein